MEESVIYLNTLFIVNKIPGPVRIFSMRLWQNASVNTIGHAMVSIFLFLRFYYFVKGFVQIYIVILEIIVFILNIQFN